MAERDPHTVPDGAVVLHIGPHKTGTTTLQKAFHLNREALAEQGVHYAGAKSQPMQAAMAAASGASLATVASDAGERAWLRLVGEVRTSQARMRVVSSEFFSDASTERIPSIIEALGGERVHVVITLRPLVRIVPSQWQQYMQNRPAVKYDDALDYEGWLAQVLAEGEAPAVTPSFWRRHRHDELVQRWVDAVGAGRVTVIVVDDSDRRMLMTTFEGLLGLTPGTLEPPQESANRSLTLPEISMLRSFNREFMAREWDLADYTAFLRFGAVRHLLERAPGPDEARLATPTWAVARICALGGEMVQRIRAIGVPVIGDLDLLSDPALAGREGRNDWDAPVPADAVASLMAGLMLVATRLAPAPAPDGRRPGRLEQVVRDYKIGRDAANEAENLRAAIADGRLELERRTPIDDLSRPRIVALLGRRLLRRLRALVRR